jgi:hypothetical protein
MISSAESNPPASNFISKLPHLCNTNLHTNSRAASPCCDWLNYLSTGERGYVPTSDGHASPAEEELRRKTFTPDAKCCQVKNVLFYALVYALTSGT